MVWCGPAFFFAAGERGWIVAIMKGYGNLGGELCYAY